MNKAIYFVQIINQSNASGTTLHKVNSIDKGIHPKLKPEPQVKGKPLIQETIKLFHFIQKLKEIFLF